MRADLPNKAVRGTVAGKFRGGAQGLWRLVLIAWGVAVAAAAGESPAGQPDVREDVFPVPLFSGRLAVLPDPLVGDLRRSQLGRTLTALGLDAHVVYLTPQQLVDPAVFDAARFPVALYLAGEPYWQTVREPEDADAALRRYLDAGGRLLVLPSGPLPFFYNQAYKPVGSAARFGLQMGIGSFSEKPPERTLTFHQAPGQDALAALPAQFPFPPPHEADQRWRPINGTTVDGARYQPWLTLRDESGRSYNDGAAAIEFASGARVVYVWCSLLAREDARRAILMAALRYALADLTPPPASLACLRVFAPPAVDGALDEAIWRLAPDSSPFVARGGSLRPAPQPTVVRACWDDVQLYLALVCTAAAAEPGADAVRVWFADAEAADAALKVGLTLGADNQLEVERPAADAASSAGADASGIRCAVQRQAGGWTAELAVPWAVLGAGERPPRFGHRQAVQFAREKMGLAPSGSGQEGGSVTGREVPVPIFSEKMGLAPSESGQEVGSVTGREVPVPIFSGKMGLAPSGSGQDCLTPGLTPPGSPGSPGTGREVPVPIFSGSVWSVTDAPSGAGRYGALVLTSHPASDDFESYPPGADGSGHWTLSGGTWRVEEGTLVGQDSCADWSQLRGALRGGDPWRDYALAVRFRVDSRSSSERDGPWFGVRCSLDGDGYVLQFGAGAWYLHKINFGIATRAENCLAQGPWAGDNAWHALRFVVRGNRLEGTLDGEPLFAVKDDAHLDLPSRRRGGIVLAAGKSPRAAGTTIVRFDDVLVHLQED